MPTERSSIETMSSLGIQQHRSSDIHGISTLTDNNGILRNNRLDLKGLFEREQCSAMDRLVTYHIKC